MDYAEFLEQTLDEVLVKGNRDLVATAFSPRYQAHAGEKTYKGQDFVLRYARQLQAFLSQLEILEVKILHSSPDHVTWQRSFQARHTDKFMGIPASGKTLQWTEMVVSRFAEGKIAEEWVVSELMGEMLLHAGPRVH